MQRVFLIGYRGSGKTTVARLLAQILGWEWCDADVVLEQRYGQGIYQIFAKEGEAAFRDKEAEVLDGLARLEKHVVATGGGIVLRPENRTKLRSGKVVWLTAAVSLAAVEVFFPQVYGGNLMTVAVVLALLSCYLALALLSAREHLH